MAACVLPHACAGCCCVAARHALRVVLALLTAALFVFGVMDLRSTAFVTAAITCEHVFPGAERTIGAMPIAAGCVLLST